MHKSEEIPMGIKYPCMKVYMSSLSEVPWVIHAWASGPKSGRSTAPCRVPELSTFGGKGKYVRLSYPGF